MMALISIKKRQYLVDRDHLKRASEITYLFCLNNHLFKQEFKMSQESFHLLESLIKNHPVFHNNLSVPQRPVQDKLMVTLHQMGISGNGTSFGVLAWFSRTSEGSVIVYCSRFGAYIGKVIAAGLSSSCR
ncbi:uncharacterized protein VP01_12g8 [Puccinia sorghi]|uniref:Uncharacterized protein n=1 Tax=Puccinia sorghi TaxID=27349 RepID=A0A0L6VNM3_9BASI|nr:uncharacterized protein VP01_12g8 [Puccinia sorghi]